MKLIHLLKLMLVTLFMSFHPLLGQAQTGNIKGIVTDQNGIYIPGANVLIDTLKRGSVSDQDGQFTLIAVPEGKYSLRITYIGYQDIEQEVALKAGETVEVDIMMQTGTVELQEVEVSALGLGGQAKALNQQKGNWNITNVVSTDQVEKFPDANIGDAVKRISGITMQVDQGEARNVIIRGLSPQLNSVTLNGSRIPSAEGDNRNVQMDLIPSDMIQTIEVNKTVTPDMDADALGGSINLVTRSTPQGFRLSTTLGSGINFITDKRIINGSLLLGNRSQNNKWGWMLAAALYDTDFGSDNIEADWTDTFGFFNGTEEEEVAVKPYTRELQQRSYLVQRVRRSFSGNLDYRIDANNDLFLKTMYNWRDDRENRFRLSQEIMDAEDIAVGDFVLEQGVLTKFPIEAKRQTKGGAGNRRNKNRRLEDQRVQNYSLGGNHLWGKVKANWMGAYAKASEERLDERYAEYESKYSIFVDNTDPKFPRFTAVDPSEANDLKNFTFSEITREEKYTEERDINAFFNAEWPVDWLGFADGMVKLGAKGRLKKKSRDNSFFEFDLEDTFPTLKSVPVKDYTDPDYLAGSQYQAGPYADEDWLGGLDLGSGESVPDEFLRDNFNVEENVWAGYVMARQRLSDQWRLLVGLRVESTHLTATGNRIENEEDAVGKVTEESAYTNVLPGIHLKYDLSEKTAFRLAWTNTLARPNYKDLVPSIDVVYGDEEIFLGNPNLKPTTSMNFDLMAEHYFESLGIFSAGLFHKRINDFVYTFQKVAADDARGAGTSGFDVFQPLNGDRAAVTGFETAFQRQLDFLPGFAKNFSLYLNYTHLGSMTKGIRNEDGELRTDLDLPNTAPNLFNGSLGYSDGRFTARLSANFSDAYIDEIGSRTFEDRYYDRQFFLDFSADFGINDHLRAYIGLNNLTDQPLRYFQGLRERTQQVEFYGRRFTVGAKYNLFKK